MSPEGLAATTSAANPDRRRDSQDDERQRDYDD
jgi:hypothetical protein